MKRWIAYYLAIAAVALGVVAGAVSPTAASQSALGKPLDEEHWDGGNRHSAGINVRSQGTGITVCAAPDDCAVLLAGVKTRSTRTEVAF